MIENIMTDSIHDKDDDNCDDDDDDNKDDRHLIIEGSQPDIL
jgi:hypothetical protein